MLSGADRKDGRMVRTLAHDDVVFVCPSSDPSSYAKYGATVIASGGTHSSDYVNKLKRGGLHTTATISCLTAHGHDLHAYPDLADATARDISGNPIAVPWLSGASSADAPHFFGCINHPAFRAFIRRKVCDAMSGGVAGIHVDDHLASAYAAIHLGGCFCDHCVSGFAAYCGGRASPDLYSAAAVTSFEGFDYRSFVNTIAPTREVYLARAGTVDGIPLHREFIDFQLTAAARNVVSLGTLAADVAQSPVSLSANVRLPLVEHSVVVPHLTYCASEIEHHAQQGPAGLSNAIEAYRMAETLKCPLAASATPQDWAFVNECGAEHLVRIWIALSYACGQRFMVPNKVLCAGGGHGPHWYCGPVAAYAPVYQFVKKLGFLLNGFSAVGPLAAPDPAPSSFEAHADRTALSDLFTGHPVSPLTAGESALVFPRVKSDGSVAIHVVGTRGDSRTGRDSVQKNLEVRLPNSLFKRNFSGATAYGYGCEPYKLAITNEGQTSSFVLPELSLWSVVAFEYWA